jgi:hypothetical protein
MTHDDQFRPLNFDEAVNAMREDLPSDQQLAQAGGRVWSRLHMQDVAADVEQIRGCADVRALLPALAAGKLSASRKLLVEDHLHECPACRTVAQKGATHDVVWSTPTLVKGVRDRGPSRWGVPQFAFAAAAIVAVAAASLFLAWYYQSPAGPRARVQSASGAIYRVTPRGAQAIAVGAELAEGELVRTGGDAHAFVQLSDGSIVEMSDRSEFSVSASRKDTTVHLDQGRIIVEAAHRRTGHLYVVTPDARVAVTGTVFAVNTGMKGSRVSVIEGAVRVSYNGTDDLLHSGDQANTSANLSQVPVAEEIAWSADLDKHLALLAEFAKIKHQIEQIPTPGMRYSSAVLDKLPPNTVFYASIPNLGDALNEANNIFQNELQQSPVLREWWNNGHNTSQGGPTFNQMVQKLHGMSQYVGSEIDVVGFAGLDSGSNGVAVIAPIKSPGLKQYLESEFTNLVSNNGQTAGLTVVGDDDLATATPVKGHELTALVGEQFVVISPNLATLRVMSNRLKSGTGGFAQTAFGQRLSDAYNRGAGLLFAVDFQSILAANQARNPGLKQSPAYLASGFSDMNYLLLEHHDVNGVPDNRAVLTFTGQRRGVVSWLAAPNPIGSLEFISPNAGGAVSFLTKEPALIFDDMLQMATGPNAGNGLAEADAKLNLDVRNDIAAQLGGDVTFALDGPVLPKPSWKMVMQVNDSSRLQYAIGKLVDAINNEAAQHQQPGLQLTSENVDDRTFYMLRSPDPKSLGMEIDYTYSDGYLVAGASRALVLESLHTRQTGDSLARSSSFQDLLPKDGHVNFSAVIYQNLSPLLKPLASQLTAQQMQALQQITAESKPTAICAYASGDRIEVASASSLLPINFNTLSIGTLLGGHRRGTSSTLQP